MVNITSHIFHHSKGTIKYHVFIRAEIECKLFQNDTEKDLLSSYMSNIEYLGEFVSKSNVSTKVILGSCR